MTLAEVKKLNAGLTFKRAVKAEIPTVREFLELVKNKDVYINWELKVYHADFGDDIAFGILDKLVDMINEYGVSERSVMNSFSAKILEYIFVKYGDKFPIHGQGIYQCRRSNDFADIKEEELFDWCCLYPSQPGFKATDFKENFDYCIKNNILPCLCIPDALEDYETAIKYGCRMFTSNNIYEASRILKKLCKK